MATLGCLEAWGPLMLLRTVGALLFTCLSFLAAPNALIEAKAQGSTQSLVLSNKNIGALKLEKNAKLELQELKECSRASLSSRKSGNKMVRILCTTKFPTTTANSFG